MYIWWQNREKPTNKEMLLVINSYQHGFLSMPLWLLASFYYFSINSKIDSWFYLLCIAAHSFFGLLIYLISFRCFLYSMCHAKYTIFTGSLTHRPKWGRKTQNEGVKRINKRNFKNIHIEEFFASFFVACAHIRVRDIYAISMIIIIFVIMRMFDGIEMEFIAQPMTE